MVLGVGATSATLQSSSPAPCLLLPLTQWVPSFWHALLALPPGQIVVLSAVFLLLLENCGAGCLSQGEGGAKREELKGKRESYLTGTWGRNSQ